MHGIIVTMERLGIIRALMRLLKKYLKKRIPSRFY
jgi:hypothetical protein